MSEVTPAFLLLLFSLSITIFSVKKENIIVPLAVAMCFLPADISLNIGRLHFYAVRVIGLLALLRIYSNLKNPNLCFNSIDKLFISYNVLGTLIYFIASQDKSGAFIYKSGTLVDSIVIYIVLRHAIQSKDNVSKIIEIFCYCVLALLPFVIFEYFTAQNLFSILGRDGISIRDGEIRAACTFSHSILFGSFAAALVPILWGGYKHKQSIVRLICIVSCVFFVYSSSSSGPIIALAASIFFLIFFKWKHYSSKLAWFTLFAATFIHIVRKMPIWHFLFVRIAIKSSSTGYHRYLLTEAAVKEFWNWWLLGYGDIGPKWHQTYWPWTYAHFTDVTNHYLLEGVRGGFFTMLLFMILCFKTIKVLGSYAISQPDQKDQWLWWGFTVMMITHCVSFLSVAYFGQITMLLYLTIAVAAYALDESRKQVPSERKRRFIK
ncbi:MAG: hypothetical protein Q8R79_02620 [Legionellaceae bacterium]|nr:hypothetical protein [Legionellaceae bacterium]